MNKNNVVVISCVKYTIHTITAKLISCVNFTVHTSYCLARCICQLHSSYQLLFSLSNVSVTQFIPVWLKEAKIKKGLLS